MDNQPPQVNIRSKMPRFGRNELGNIKNNLLFGYLPNYGGISRLNNQDQLLVSKGGYSWRQLDTYIDLLTDPHCFSMWDKQMSEITAKKWEVTPKDPKNKLDIAASELCASILENLGFSDDDSDGTFALANSDLGFNDIERSFHLSLFSGHSEGEIMWGRDNKGHIIPTQIKHRDPRRFQFHINGDGKIYPKLLTHQHPIDGVFLPPRKLLILQYWAVPSEDPHGFSLGRFLYFPVQWKREALTYWLKIIDKHHEPTRVGTYNPTAQQAQIEEFFSVIQRISNDTAILLPEGFSVDFVNHNAENAEKLLMGLIEYCDRQISLVLLGETTSGEGLSGNVASEDINNSIRVNKAKNISDRFLKMFQQNVFKWVTEINYPGAGIPNLSRQWNPKENRDVILDRIQKLTQSGFRVDPAWVSNYIGIPLKVQKALKPIPE